MLNFALHEVLRNLSIHGRFIVVCLDEGVRGLGEGAWVPNLCPPVPAPSIHRCAWKLNSANFAFTEFSDVRFEGRSTPGSPTRLAEGWLWGLRDDAQSSTHHLLQV
jgi:hypothetical protein